MEKTGRIEKAILKAKESGRLSLISYFVYGYPDLKSSEEIIRILADKTDIVEIGFPFSDPLADGTTIQEASEVALKNNPKIEDVLSFVYRLRKKKISTPFILMSYLNPIYRYGFEKFVRKARAAGLDGVIFPDLPVEEAEEWLEISKDSLETVFLVSPLTDDKRLKKIDKLGSGFIYCVSVLGTTGARSKVSCFLEPFLKRVRKQTKLPLAVGFGFSQPAQIISVKSMVDGVIVGSALIDAFNQGLTWEEKLSLLEDKIKILKRAL